MQVLVNVLILLLDDQVLSAYLRKTNYEQEGVMQEGL